MISVTEVPTPACSSGELQWPNIEREMEKKDQTKTDDDNKSYISRLSVLTVCVVCVT